MAGLFRGARRVLQDFAKPDAQGRTLGDKLALFGATLRDVSDPSTGALDRQVALIGRRQAEAMSRQAMDRLRSNLSPLDGADGSAGTGAARSPADIQAALMQGATDGLDVGPLAQAWQQFQPRLFQTGTNIVSVGPDQKPSVLYTAPVVPEASPGWTVKPDGTWAPVPGGPYDPAYIERAAGVRRDAVVARPTPSRARASSGGSRSGVSRSSGGSAATRASAPRTNPWDRDY